MQSCVNHYHEFSTAKNDIDAGDIQSLKIRALEMTVETFGNR